MESSTKRTAVGVLLVVVGVVTVLNPLYLDRLLPGPTGGAGIDLTPLAYTALSTTGCLCLSVGAYSILRSGRLTSKRALTIAVLAILLALGFSLVWNIAVFTLGEGPGWDSMIRFTFPSGETVFLESVLAFLFPLGVAVGDRDRHGVLLVGGGITAALVIDGLLSSPLGVFSGVVGAVALLYGINLFGIPHFGALIAAMLFVLGLGYNHVLHPASTDGASEPGDTT